MTVNGAAGLPRGGRRRARSCWCTAARATCAAGISRSRRSRVLSGDRLQPPVTPSRTRTSPRTGRTRCSGTWTTSSPARSADAAPAHLVGHSWGGFICLLTAIRHPELVRSLVLAEPPVLSLFISVPPKPRRELLAMLVRHPRTGLAILGFGAAEGRAGRSGLPAGADEAALATLGPACSARKPSRGCPRSAGGQARENVNTRASAAARRGVPAVGRRRMCAESGRADPAHDRRPEPGLLAGLTDGLERLLPNAERVEIAGASHAMTEENPAR